MKNPVRKQTHKSIGFALRQLLLEGNVGTHEDICKALQKQGFHVNQPKVSRLMNKLGAVKVTNPQGETVYRLPHEHGLAHELTRSSTQLPTSQWVIDVVTNNVMIIIHTSPGAAALIAREVDLHRVKLGILGSIAGDDTIFIAPKDVKTIKSIIEGIKSILSL